MYLSNICNYFRRYFAGGVCKCKTDLTNKVVIVTGGTSGIGKEIATVLAERGKIVKLLLLAYSNKQNYFFRCQSCDC